MDIKKFADRCADHRLSSCWLFASLTMFVAAVMPKCSQAASPSPVLLAFSSEQCINCVAMEPVLKDLARQGVPIRRVDVGREPDFARRHGIKLTPTFVVWSNGRELTRLVGMQSPDQIRSALAVGANARRFLTAADLSGEQASNAAHAAAASRHVAQGAESMPSVAVADATERARAATVRLKVRDGKGFGVGTGTIIDRHGEEALVLTCGHLFRETQLDSQVTVELFVGGQIQSVEGQVIDFDSENRDIGLVVIRPGFDVVPVPVLPASETPTSGQSVFSYGCDHGADPSRQDTRITGMNKYNQHVHASNIEIAGAPVDGRSGGGLFDAAGRLIGVCNAADYQDDVGIYTGPGSIKWQLDRVQLSHLYEGKSPGPVPGQGHSPNPPVQLASANAPVLNAPIRTADTPANVAPERQLPSGTRSSAQEILIIVRDPSGQDRVMTVRQPSPELLRMIERSAK